MESLLKVQKWWVRIKVTLAAVGGLIGVAFIILWSGIRRGREEGAARERTKQKLKRVDQQVQERDTEGLKKDTLEWTERWK